MLKIIAALIAVMLMTGCIAPGQSDDTANTDGDAISTSAGLVFPTDSDMVSVPESAAPWGVLALGAIAFTVFRIKK